MYSDAETLDSFYVDYLVACYNARQGWLPQGHDLDDNDKDDKGKPKIIEFDNKESKFCKTKITI